MAVSCGLIKLVVSVGNMAITDGIAEGDAEARVDKSTSGKNVYTIGIANVYALEDFECVVGVEAGVSKTDCIENEDILIANDATGGTAVVVSLIRPAVSSSESAPLCVIVSVVGTSY